MNKLKIGLLVFIIMVVSFSSVPVFAAGTWETTGSMAVTRYFHAATLLQNGNVLVTGGVSADEKPTATAEIYDPSTGTWNLTANMSTARSRHTATLLQDGRVLIAGGRGLSGLSLRAAELYDPATGGWTSVAPMTYAHAFATATLLSDGRVLVTGGLSDDYVYGPANNSAEIYDPNTGVWTVVDHMANARGASRRSPSRWDGSHRWRCWSRRGLHL